MKETLGQTAFENFLKKNATNGTYTAPKSPTGKSTATSNGSKQTLLSFLFFLFLLFVFVLFVNKYLDPLPPRSLNPSLPWFFDVKMGYPSCTCGFLMGLVACWFFSLGLESSLVNV